MARGVWLACQRSGELLALEIAATGKPEEAMFADRRRSVLLLLLLFVVHTKKGAIKQKLKDESERERLHTRKMSDKKFKG